MSKEEEFKRKLNEMGAQVDASINMFVPMHAIYVQMLEAGFNETQACKIIGTWMATAGEGPKK